MNTRPCSAPFSATRCRSPRDRLEASPRVAPGSPAPDVAMEIWRRDSRPRNRLAGPAAATVRSGEATAAGERPCKGDRPGLHVCSDQWRVHGYGPWPTVRARVRGRGPKACSARPGISAPMVRARVRHRGPIDSRNTLRSETQPARTVADRRACRPRQSSVKHVAALFALLASGLSGIRVSFDFPAVRFLSYSGYL
jgi:hypothetical protein